MKLKLKGLARDFISLLYPELCSACGLNRHLKNSVFCTRCHYKLPFTNFHFERENLLTDRFWGRFNLCAGTAMLYFTKGSKVQNLIHNLKYKNKRNIGLVLGETYGQQLSKSKNFDDVDIIIPVPLHLKKLRLRGYNQSDLFAAGLSKSLGFEWSNNCLLRLTNSHSQTRKSRLERLENSLHAFKVKNPSLIKNKHILLVDDVITSGATLESCALKLLEVPNTRISIATIAIANH